MSRAQILSGIYDLMTFCLLFQLLCKDGLYLPIHNIA